MDRKQEAGALRAELAASFADRAYPGDETFVRNLSDDGAEARAWIDGRNWRDLIEQGLTAEHREVIHSLTPEGWLYYFPAFATLALDLDDPMDLDDALLVKLAWWPQELKPLLREGEHRAIARWLEHLARCYDERGWENLPRYALDFHWSPKSGGDEPIHGEDGLSPPHQEIRDALS